MEGKRVAKPDKQNRKELAPLLAIGVILLGLSAASLLLPDQAFSANENRYLQQKPKLTWQSLMSGDFTADAEDYISDQIALRESWMEGKSVLQKFSGKKDIGGVYLCWDGSYFARVTEDDFNREQFEKNVGFVKDLFAANEDKSCRILLAPTPATTFEEVLPANAEMYDIDSCYALLRDTFGSASVETKETLHGGMGETYYYRTDHHWTSQGAQAAYEMWAKSTGHIARSYNLTEVTDSFRGTMYSKVLLPDSAYDSIYLDKSVTIRSMDCDGTEYPSLYVDAALEQKDKYEVFMGGNYARVNIDTGVENGKSLLLIKDSFANSFIPFIAGDYETVTVLDLRYYKGSVQELAEDADDILVLYEMSNFASERNIFKVIQ